MPDQEAIKNAMKSIGESLKTLNKEETDYLKKLRGEIEKQVESDPSLDKQMEFCYAVLFSPDVIKNDKLIKAVREYINVAQE